MWIRVLKSVEIIQELSQGMRRAIASKVFARVAKKKRNERRLGGLLVVLEDGFFEIGDGNFGREFLESHDEGEEQRFLVLEGGNG